MSAILPPVARTTKVEYVTKTKLLAQQYKTLFDLINDGVTYVPDFDIYVCETGAELDKCKETLKAVLAVTPNFEWNNIDTEERIEKIYNPTNKSIILSTDVVDMTTSTNIIGCVTAEKFYDYDITVKISSDSSDDDFTGIVLGYALSSNDTETEAHTLMLFRSPQTRPEVIDEINPINVLMNDSKTSRWAIYLDANNAKHGGYGDNTILLTSWNMETSWLSNVIENETHKAWNALTSGVTLNAIKTNNSYYCKTSLFGDAENIVRDDTLLSINIDSLLAKYEDNSNIYDRLKLFKGTLLLIGCFEQSLSSASFEFTKFPIKTPVIVNLENLKSISYNYNNNEWDELDIAPGDIITHGKLSYNSITKKVFINNGPEIRNIASNVYDNLLQVENEYLLTATYCLYGTIAYIQDTKEIRILGNDGNYTQLSNWLEPISTTTRIYSEDKSSNMIIDKTTAHGYITANTGSAWNIIKNESFSADTIIRNIYYTKEGCYYICTSRGLYRTYDQSLKNCERVERDKLCININAPDNSSNVLAMIEIGMQEYLISINYLANYSTGDVMPLGQNNRDYLVGRSFIFYYNSSLRSDDEDCVIKYPDYPNYIAHAWLTDLFILSEDYTTVQLLGIAGTVELKYISFNKNNHLLEYRPLTNIKINANSSLMATLKIIIHNNLLYISTGGERGNTNCGLYTANYDEFLLSVVNNSELILSSISTFDNTYVYNMSQLSIYTLNTNNTISAETNLFIACSNSKEFNSDNLANEKSGLFILSTIINEQTGETDEIFMLLSTNTYPQSLFTHLKDIYKTDYFYLSEDGTNKVDTTWLFVGKTIDDNNYKIYYRPSELTLSDGYWLTSDIINTDLSIGNTTYPTFVSIKGYVGINGSIENKGVVYLTPYVSNPYVAQMSDIEVRGIKLNNKVQEIDENGFVILGLSTIAIEANEELREAYQNINIKLNELSTTVNTDIDNLSTTLTTTVNDLSSSISTDINNLNSTLEYNNLVINNMLLTLNAYINNFINYMVNLSINYELSSITASPHNLYFVDLSAYPDNIPSLEVDLYPISVLIGFNGLVRSGNPIIRIGYDLNSSCGQDGLPGSFMGIYAYRNNTTIYYQTYVNGGSESENVLINNNYWNTVDLNTIIIEIRAYRINNSNHISYKLNINDNYVGEYTTTDIPEAQFKLRYINIGPETYNLNPDIMHVYSFNNTFVTQNLMEQYVLSVLASYNLIAESLPITLTETEEADETEIETDITDEQIDVTNTNDSINETEIIDETPVESE